MFISLETVIRSENDFISLFESNLVLAIGKESTSNLGALGVEQDGNVARFERRHLAQSIEDGAVSFVIAVGKVESRHVHAGVHEGGNALFRPTRRTHGADNFGAAILDLRLGFDILECDVTTVKSRDRCCIGNHGDVECTVYSVVCNKFK